MHKTCIKVFLKMCHSVMHFSFFFLCCQENFLSRTSEFILMVLAVFKEVLLYVIRKKSHACLFHFIHSCKLTCVNSTLVCVWCASFLSCHQLVVNVQLIFSVKWCCSFSTHFIVRTLGHIGMDGAFSVCMLSKIYFWGVPNAEFSHLALHVFIFSVYAQ